MESWNTEATTAARDASIMRTHVLPQWGAWQLAKIDQLAIQSWITALGMTRSRATVAEAHRLTLAVLRSAVRNRLVPFNPAEGIRVPRRRKQDTDERIISRHELRTALLPALPARHRAIVATASGTGLRWGEVAGLRRDALDLHGRSLSVLRTVIEVSGNTTFKAFPKSAAGRRTVPLPRWLVTIVGEHLERWPTDPNGPVFANEVGGPLRRTVFRSRIWRTALVRAGMLGKVVPDGDHYRAEWTDTAGASHTEETTTESAAVRLVARNQAGGLRFHDLRHSYATWLVDDGVPPNMVQRVMGHERSSTTLDLYTRRTDNSDRILRALDDEDEGGEELPGAGARE
jgi:integrase